MYRNLVQSSLVALGLTLGAPSAYASVINVDLELIVAIDTSGSVDATDFALRRGGIEAAFRDADVISAIMAGTTGQISVALWDFGSSVGVAVDWFLISSSAQANSFADAVAGAGRTSNGSGDGQANMLRQAATNVAGNNYSGTRVIVDIVSEGVQSGEGCSYNVAYCQATIDARGTFLAAGGTAVNAIWMNDRDYFGLDAADAMNAFVYGSTSVIGGAGAFQVFAETNADFTLAFKNKIIREVRPPDGVPEPSALLFIGLGLAGLGALRRKRQTA